jgi:dTDP-4-amino-4,6-dideoxygalactose transaminase
VQVPQRDELQAWLKTQGVSTGIHYPVPVHLQQAMGFLGYRTGDLPVTERATAGILSLPMYAELTEAEIEYVVNQITGFFHTDH